MNIYRDCNSNGANFDSSIGSVDAATITIFEGNNQFTILSLGDPSVTEIQPNLDNPCLTVPPNICVEQGIYTFTTTLPQSAQSYHISYQRCCRNNTISNINMPAVTGATYTIELKPEAQNICNDSPVFNDFPPIAICVNEPLNFDHSASDDPSSQLVYSFCAPFEGGGVAGSGGPASGNFEALNGVAPNPDAPPPYNDVVFIAPTYSPTRPMGGSPLVSINPSTGLITGTPDIEGQFVVGVCVDEYRNGQLISTVKRDFQFNVTSCMPTVIADIKEDEIINGQEFLINVCGNQDAEIINQSVQQINIDEYFWTFDLGGTEPDTILTWNAEVSFPDTGQYVGYLFLNPGTICADTATIYINVFPEIVSDFEYVYDTCVAGPIDFSDLSFTGADEIVEWSWNFGDGSFSETPNPSYQYQTPGEKPILLQVTDNNGCKSVLDQTIYWVPAPREIIVEPTTFLGCAPQTIFLNNLSTPIDETYDIFWDLGDGNTSTAISPTHIYEEPGVYSVTLDIISPIGCYIGAEYPNWITVRESPIAGFSFSPTNPSSFNPDVDFFDESQRAVYWEWFINDVSFSLNPNPSYTFPDTGFYEVVQIVTHENACQDTAFRLLDIEPLVTYFIPNAFSPNGDGNNDFFLGKGIFRGITDFEMTIWNRWGELIFQTDDPELAWNGQKNNNGAPSPNGVYVYKIQYTEPRGAVQNLKGFVTLIR